MKKSCKSCNHFEHCVRVYNLYSCCNDYEAKPLTNEEWFNELSTEEKAKVLRRKTYGNGEENEREEQGWVNWLKAQHEDNPPDIPSVPSWDRWLQGEKTKCELCDGSGAECNLVGRFECPKTPKTEQEYLQTCNTEQLAEWIVNAVLFDKKIREVIFEECTCSYEGKVMAWLKQPHTIKE